MPKIERLRGGPMSRHRSALLSLFARLGTLKADPFGNRLIGLSIQEELIVRISNAERSIRRLRRSIAENKQALRRRENSKAESQALKNRARQLGEAVNRQNEIIDVLRDIGDSIAFLYIDRFDLKPLAFKEPPGFISGKRGCRLERKTFRYAYENGLVAILNDLTHTLRHGDVTILDEHSPMSIIECKSGRGGKRSRGDRQLAQAQKMLDYLREDVRHEQSGSWHRVEALAMPVSLGGKATALAQKLPQGGWLHEQVERGLHYIVLDCTIDETGQNKALSVIDPIWRPYVIMVNEMKRMKMGYMPFPLHFTDDEITYRFYNGEFVMAVVVELREVEKRLAESGMSFEITDDGYFPFKIGPQDLSEGELGDNYVGYHPMGRLAAEFVSLDWLVRNVMSGPVSEYFWKFQTGKA